LIRADDLVKGMHEAGYRLVSGVPCSFLSPLINAAIDAPGLRYVSAANEGDAAAVAAGAELAGVRAAAMFQNSGLGNAVSPLTSLHAVFRIPILLIATWRGRPGGRPDEPQHGLMGRVTPALLDLLEIPWEPAPREEGEIGPALERAERHMASRGTPFAWIVAEGTFEPRGLSTPPPGRIAPPDAAPPRGPLPELDPDEVLAAVRLGTTDAVVLATTGFTGRALYALGDRPNHLYLVGSMGCAASVGLGIALSRPERRVVVVDGDGSVLMRMGALASVGREAPENFLHVLLDNGVHESTGGQATAASAVDFPAVARGCGYSSAVPVEAPRDLEAILAAGDRGPVLAYARTRLRLERKLPRPAITPAEVAARLRAHLAGEEAARPAPSRPARDRLLNPGPVTLSSRVRAALSGPDVCHREPEYAALQTDVRERLHAVHGASTQHAAVLLSGSGTSAVEAMLGSLVPRDGRALVASNGVYGERMTAILEIQGKAHTVVRSEWTGAIAVEEVARVLGEGEYSHVVAVHHETTTGRLNDVGGLSQACRRHGVPLLLDAVSSYGGERLDLAGWNVEACAATANKCLHGAPGVAFVVARREALTRSAASPSLSLDLARHFAEQEEGAPLFTPPVHVMRALAEALAEHVDEGGWEARRARHRELSDVVRRGLCGLGFGLLLPSADDYAASLTSFSLPIGTAFEDLHGPLKERGFVIYPGQRGLRSTIFRVAVMGDLDHADMESFVAEVGGLVKGRARNGASVRRPVATLMLEGTR